MVGRRLHGCAQDQGSRAFFLTALAPAVARGRTRRAHSIWYIPNSAPATKAIRASPCLGGKSFSLRIPSLSAALFRSSSGGQGREACRSAGPAKAGIGFSVDENSVSSALRVSPVCADRRPCSARGKPLFSNTMQKNPPKVHGGGESGRICLKKERNLKCRREKL